MSSRLAEMTAEQVADELYGLHCDIGRLEQLNERLRCWCGELYRMADPNKCDLCGEPCSVYGDDIEGCSMVRELKELEVNV